MKTDLSFTLPSFFKLNEPEHKIDKFLFELKQEYSKLQCLAYHQKLEKILNDYPHIKFFWQLHLDINLNELSIKEHGCYIIIHWLVNINNTFFSLGQKDSFFQYNLNGTTCFQQSDINEEVLIELKEIKKKINDVGMYYMPQEAFQYYYFSFNNTGKLIELDKDFISYMYEEILTRETMEYREKYFNSQKACDILNSNLSQKNNNSHTTTKI